MGLNAGILHPGISHALAALIEVLSTMCRNLNASLSHVACCCCRAVSSGVRGESLVNMAAMSDELQSTEPGLLCGADSFLITASDCMGLKHGERTAK